MVGLVKRPDGHCVTMNFRDLTGQHFGRLIVIGLSGFAEYKKRGRTYRVSEWRCRCDCGSIKQRIGKTALMSGRTQSCGCLRHYVANAPTGDALPMPGIGNE